MKKGIRLCLIGISILLIYLLFRFILSGLLDALLIANIQRNIPSGYEYKTKEECEKKKGDWGKAGLFPKEFCRIPLSDAGKPCIAGFQCKAGICLSNYMFRNSPLVTMGTCPKYQQTFGCTQEVHFGFTSHAMCRD